MRSITSADAATTAEAGAMYTTTSTNAAIATETGHDVLTRTWPHC